MSPGPSMSARFVRLKCAAVSPPWWTIVSRRGPWWLLSAEPFDFMLADGPSLR